MTVIVEGLDPLPLAYLEHCRRIRVPHNTIRARARSLRSVGRPGEITREELEAWWYRRADEVSDVTRANDLANLRGFYKWCQMWEHRQDDPSVRLQRPNVQPGLPRGISGADLQAVLNHVVELEDHVSRRAIALGAYAGMRISEIATLPWSAIDAQHRRIRVEKSKGGKSRLVAVAPELLTILGPPHRRTTSVVTGAEFMPVQTLGRRVARVLAAAGVDATSHQLRHYHGTVFYQATRDLVATGKQLGHASVATTQIYAAAADEVSDVGAAAAVAWSPPEKE